MAAKRWEQPKRPLLDGQMDTVWTTHKVDKMEETEGRSATCYRGRT